MSLMGKALLFCLIPGILFCLFATPPGNSKESHGEPWGRFMDRGTAYVAPPGLEVHDPFTTGIRAGTKRWPMDWPARETTRMAYFRSERGTFQIFLVLGPRSELEPILERAQAAYEDSPQAERDGPHDFRTKDGVEVVYDSLYTLPGPHAGDGDTVLLGYGVRGERILLVNAGGVRQDFDVSAVRDLVASIQIGR